MEKFKSFREDNVDRFPTGNTKSVPSDSVKPRTSDSAMYSDATLTILSNKNNPVVNILFSNVYPVSLSSLQYTNDSTDTEYLSATATFQYQIYDFENLKNITKHLTNNLNNIIDYNYYPTKETKTSNMRHRPIGLGVQGLANVFLEFGYSFDSEKAKSIIEREIGSKSFKNILS